MFSKLLFFVQGYSGAANANIDADDHELGGRSANFAEGGKDVQYGDIYDRTPPPSKFSMCLVGARLLLVCCCSLLPRDRFHPTDKPFCSLNGFAVDVVRICFVWTVFSKHSI